MRYDRKASVNFGGLPVVYIVEPTGDIWHVHSSEYVADSAEIMGVADTL